MVQIPFVGTEKANFHTKSPRIVTYGVSFEPVIRQKRIDGSSLSHKPTKLRQPSLSVSTIVQRSTLVTSPRIRFHRLDLPCLWIPPGRKYRLPAAQYLLTPTMNLAMNQWK